MKNSNIPTATVTTVSIGYLEFEGLLLQDGSFAIAVPQVCNILGLAMNQASRDIKAILGKGFGFDKARTKAFGSVTKTNSGNKKAVNVLQLKDFERVIFELTLKGNEKAIEISRDLIGLSLQQLFSDAFCLKFEKEDRQRWLKNRQESKEKFWFLTDSIKEWIDSNPTVSDNTKKFIYNNAMNAINKGLFGKNAKTIKYELGIPKGDLNREHFGITSLERITDIQKLGQAFIKQGQTPLQAINSSLVLMNFDIIDYNE